MWHRFLARFGMTIVATAQAGMGMRRGVWSVAGSTVLLVGARV
jgi:hypothetical protein